MNQANYLQVVEGPGVFITGTRGFLGRHVTERFGRSMGEDSWFNSIHMPGRETLDLLGGVDTILEYFQGIKHKPLAVIHLAAHCGGIGANSKRPGEFLYNNLTMTTNLIEACRLHGINRFVGIGTVCSYPADTPVPFKEEDLYNGYPEVTNAPYGLAKRMQLEQIRAYRKQYGLNGIFLMPVNMAGEYDHFDDANSHVIPALIKKFHTAKMIGQSRVSLWGDGSASREFLYAGDCAEAIYQATRWYNDPDPVNIGTGREITIKELAEMIRGIVGFQGEIEWDTSKPNGQMRRCLDTSRAKERFGFEAKTSLEETVLKSYEYFRKEVLNEAGV